MVELSDIDLLEFMRQYYYADDLSEAHETLSTIVYDDGDAAAQSYDACFQDGEYVMPDDMRDFALSIHESFEDEEDIGFSDEDIDDDHESE